MKTSISDPRLGMTHLDVECRLEGMKTDWDNIRNIYKDIQDGQAFKKEDYSSQTLEALDFFKKKRFWVSYRLMKLQQSLKDESAENPDISSNNDIIDSCVADAKLWILAASPIEWEGMLACYEHCATIVTIGSALDRSMELYNSLL